MNSLLLLKLKNPGNSIICSSCIMETGKCWQAHCSPIGWYFASTNYQPIGEYMRVGLVWPCYWKPPFFKKSFLGILVFFSEFAFLPKYTDIQRKVQVEKPIKFILVNRFMLADVIFHDSNALPPAVMLLFFITNMNKSEFKFNILPTIFSMNF